MSIARWGATISRLSWTLRAMGAWTRSSTPWARSATSVPKHCEPSRGKRPTRPSPRWRSASDG